MKFYEDAWLEDLKSKIDILDELNNTVIQGKTLKSEALILCVVYIDQLSGRLKKIKTEKGRFAKLLIEHGKNPVFQRVVFKQLLRKLIGTKNNNMKKIVDKIKKYFHANGCRINDEMNNIGEPNNIYSDSYESEQMISFLGNNFILDKKECEQIKSEMWRGSIASVCYDEIRNSTIHHTTISSLNIGDISINFGLLYAALINIYTYIKACHDQNGGLKDTLDFCD